MQQATPRDSREDPAATLLRRFFPLYCVLTAFITYGYALYDTFQVDGDAIAYMDIGDNLRAHHWPGIVNGYWHPMYPAFLSIGHILCRATLATELHAYYHVNFAIFLLEMLAIVLFTDAILRLRTNLATNPGTNLGAPGLAFETLDSRHEIPNYILTKYPLRYLGLALLTIASQRELSLGKVRPDALLQAFLLLALAALLTHLATSKLRYAALMGLALGCAYLTKSFAFVLTFFCILTVAAFRWLWLKHSLAKIIPAAVLALATFAIIAGPYIAALSHQHGRLDFGDSGSLNYAWYVAGTDKVHLQPYQTSHFGAAEVHLKHPEKELLHSPLVLSYAEMPYGTYPDWFDPTYWNDRIKPHFNLRGELSRSARNGVLVVRYLFNHPEALIFLALLLTLGARLTLPWRFWKPTQSANPFWLPSLLLGVLIWTIYATVNTEERYVTVAYLSIILTLFATLRSPVALGNETSGAPSMTDSPSWVGCKSFGHLSPTASLLILLLAILATGESLRTVLEDRRVSTFAGFNQGPHSYTDTHAATALHNLGVQSGDTVACIGLPACLQDFYWARLAGVRITTEIYDPDAPVYPFLLNLPNRDQAIAAVRAQGAKALIGDFEHARVSDPAFQNWHQLDDTTLYALPLNPPSPH